MEVVRSIVGQGRNRAARISAHKARNEMGIEYPMHTASMNVTKGVGGLLSIAEYGNEKDERAESHLERALGHYDHALNLVGQEAVSPMVCPSSSVGLHP